MGLGCRSLVRLRGLYSAGLQGQGFQALASVALALDIEYNGIVKDPVQSAQQRVILIEVGSPVGRMLVTGKYNVEVTFLVVSPVNQIKEQTGILLVELTVTHFINN